MNTNTNRKDGGVRSARERHQQMLKLVAKGFCNELRSYGVQENEILTVAGHLLDNLMHKDTPANGNSDYYNRLFCIGDVQDEWVSKRHLNIHQVSLKPMEPDFLPSVASWLNDPAMRANFHPPFPDSLMEMAPYFGRPSRQYFVIFHQREPVGIIGAENIDRTSGKLEMRKLIANPNLRGRGIGKRATFLFLYYVFCIMKFNKVYLYSLDINIRNINLNSKFGFELEGVFFEEVSVQNQLQDVLRMGLRAPAWLALFAGKHKLLET